MPVAAPPAMAMSVIAPLMAPAGSASRSTAVALESVSKLVPGAAP